MVKEMAVIKEDTKGIKAIFSRAVLKCCGCPFVDFPSSEFMLPRDLVWLLVLGSKVECVISLPN